MNTTSSRVRSSNEALAAEDSAAVRTFSVADAERRPLRVLVVEDDPLLRWAISEVLRRSGHTVIEVWNAAAALRALSDTSGRLDAVLLDVLQPDSTDLALLATFRRLSRRAVSS